MDIRRPTLRRSLLALGLALAAPVSNAEPTRL